MPTLPKLFPLVLAWTSLIPTAAGLASSRPGAGAGPPPSGPPSAPARSSPGLTAAQARELVAAGRRRVEQREATLEQARQEAYRATDAPALAAAQRKVAVAEAALADAKAKVEHWQAALTRLGPAVAAPEPGEAREAREAKAPPESKETKTPRPVAAAGQRRPRVGSSPTRTLAPRRDHPFFTWSKRQAPGDVFRFTTAREGWASFPEKLVLSETGALFWWDRKGEAIRRLDPDGSHHVHFHAGVPLSRAELYGWSAGPDGVCLLASLSSRAFRGLHFLYAPRDLLDATHPPVMAPLGATVVGRPLALVPPFEAGPGREAVAVLPRQLLFFTVGDPRGTCTVVRKQVAGPDLGPGTVLLKRPGSGFWFLDPGRGTVGFLRFPTEDQYEVVVHPFKGKAGHLALRRAGTTPEDDEIFITFPEQDRIGRYSYRTKEYEAFQLRPGTAPGAMAAGPGGHMLFTTADGFGRFAPDGQITRLPVHAGHLRPLDLLPNLAVGKLYFTERDRTLLGALTLGEPGKLTEEGALCGGPGGESLLAEEDEFFGIGMGTATPAPVVRRRPAAAETKTETKAETKAETAGAGAAVSAATGAAGAVPEGAGAQAAAGADPAGADPAEPEDPPSDPEDAEDPFAEVGLCLAGVATGEAAQPARIVRLVNRRISPGAITHILREHAHQEVVLRPASLVKGQFAGDLLKDERGLRQLLFSCANAPEAEVWYEGPDDTVIEFTTAREVGRVCPAGSRRWVPSRRLRLVLTRDGATGRDWLTTAYPVPEPAPAAGVRR